MSRRTTLLLRWTVFAAACAFLFSRLAADQSTYAGGRSWHTALSLASWPVWALMVVLSLVNWGLEALKWRGLVARLEPLGIGQAFRATLAGTAMGLVTPNRSGEFAGRVLFLAPEHRWRGGMAALLGGIAQFITTLVFGAVAMAWWWHALPKGPAVTAAWLAGGVALLAALVVLSLWCYFRPWLLRRLIQAVPVLRRLDGAASLLEDYSPGHLRAVLCWSMARYIVFAAQYMLLLLVLAEVGWQYSAVIVPMIFLTTTLVPTMVLSELGVRGSVAVALLAPLGGQPGLVLLASFGVWAVNLALPAAAGALIILVARIRTGE